MIKQECFTSLSELLTKQNTSIEVAITYLNNIKTSIESGNLESLQQLIQHNEIPLSQIEDQEIARFCLIESCGFDKNKQGFEHCIKACDDANGSLNDLYHQLNESFELLQKQTDANALLVSKNKERVKKSLSILTGNSLKKDPTYSSQGTTNQGSLSRPIAIA